LGRAHILVKVGALNARVQEEYNNLHEDAMTLATQLARGHKTAEVPGRWAKMVDAALDARSLPQLRSLARSIQVPFKHECSLIKQTRHAPHAHKV
jgi:hypothetical protein